MAPNKKITPKKNIGSHKRCGMTLADKLKILNLLKDGERVSNRTTCDVSYGVWCIK